MRGLLTVTLLAMLTLPGTGHAQVSSSDPYEKARPDSPLVRKLLATPIPEDPHRIGYVSAALEMLGQDTAQPLGSYLERTTLLAALGEPPLKARTVAEAIELESRAPPIDEVRRRLFENILAARLATPADVVPEGIRANRSRYRQETPVVWEPVEQNDKAIVHYLHVVLRNEGRTDISGFRGTLVLSPDPAVELNCEAQNYGSSINPVLRAGQSLPLFCSTDWQKKIPLDSVIAASRALEAGQGQLAFRPHWLLLHDAGFDLQHYGSSFMRRRFATSGFDAGGRGEAASIVRGSSCFDRGTCIESALGGFGPLQSWAWIAVAAGVFVYGLAALVARSVRVRARTIWIITAVAALLPILVFAGVLGEKHSGLGVLFVPIFGAHLWAAFIAGLWATWLITLTFRRRAAS